MIRLKYDDRDDTIGIYQGPKRMVSLAPADFGDLIREVRRVMEEASPALVRKQERKKERRNMINHLKIMLSVWGINILRRIIVAYRRIKSFFTK